MGDMLAEAIRLTKLGFMVHPLTGPNSSGNSPGKRPIKKDWQKQITPYNESVMSGWWGTDAKTDHNMGLVCGRASDVMVIDMDSMLFADELLDGIEINNTLRSARTKGRGHIYFRYDPGLPASKHHTIGIEILSDNNNAVLPPSVHVSGDVYHWADPDAPIQEMPNELKQRLLNLFELDKRVAGLVRKCRPCFQRVFKEKPDLHGADGREMMLAFCTELKANGARSEDIRFVAKIVYQDRYDQERTDSEFRTIDESKTWKCVTIQDKLGVFVSDEQCGKCGQGQPKHINAVPSTASTKNDQDKPCTACRAFRSGVNDKLEEWAKCLKDDVWLNPFQLRTCARWEPKLENSPKKEKEPVESNDKTAIELLTHKYDAPEVVDLIREIGKVIKERPNIKGEDYIYRICLRGRCLVIPSKFMLSWNFFSRRCLEEFDEKPPSDMGKVKIWDLFLKALKEEELIEVVEPLVQDDFGYDAEAFLNELRSYRIVESGDNYKNKKNILVKQDNHYFIPAENARAIKVKLGLKIPHKNLLELISIRYKCGAKAVRVAGETRWCWEFHNGVISEDFIEWIPNERV